MDQNQIHINSPEEIEGMRRVGRKASELLDFITPYVKVGVSTAKLDKLMLEYTQDELKCRSACLNYAPGDCRPYPAATCISVNHVICHGIPSEEDILKEGDIVNVDCSTILNGYFSDSSRMFCIGEVSAEKKRLVDVTKECIQKGLEQVKPWGFLGDMGQAVHDHAYANGYTVVREIGGHGIGLEFHEEPWVGYNSKAGTEMLMVPGMVFTIEPMVNMGQADIFVDEENDWTVYTADGQPSAQWEVMVLVTEDGYEIISY